MQKDITSLQLRLVATVRRSRAAAAVVVNLCSLWMSSEAFTGDRWRLPRLPTLYVEIDFSQTFQASPKFKDISKCTNI